MFIPFKPKKHAMPTERCVIFGEDGRIQDKALVSTGAFFRDEANDFAYDSLPDCMGVLIINDKHGNTKIEGHCAVLYEISAQPYLFKEARWAPECQSQATILADGRAEGSNMARAEIEVDTKWERWMPVLYVSLAILALITVIACVAGGVFDSLGEVF